MNKRIFLLVIVSLLAGAMNVSHAADDGAKLFDAKCASCHTVGKGQLVGPDLASVKDWEESKAHSAVSRMQSMAGAMTEEEISSITKFLQSTSANTEAVGKQSEATSSSATSSTPSSSTASSATSSSATPGSATPSSATNVPERGSSLTSGATALVQGNAIEGEKLFSGQKSLANGGMSCIACHNSAGEKGGLGPALANIEDKMSEAALIASCRQTPFKVMKAAYEKHPVTDQEAADLAKYLVSAKGKVGDSAQPFVPYGVAGAVLIILTVAIGYHKRNSSVHSKLHRR